MWRLHGGKHRLIVVQLPLLLGLEPGHVQGQNLLSLIPPGPQFVEAVSAPTRHDWPGSFILTTRELKADESDFYTLTGAGVFRSIRQIVYVAELADNSQDRRQHSLLVDGDFDWERTFGTAKANGASSTTYRGVSVLVVPPLAREVDQINEIRWLARLDLKVAAFGSIGSVQREIYRYQNGGEADPSLLRRLHSLHRDDRTWCVISIPARNAEIRRAFMQLNPALGDLLHEGYILQFGIRYGRQIELEYQIGLVAPPPVFSDGSASVAPAFEMHEKNIDPHCSEATDANRVTHGVIKLSKSRYRYWLAAVSAGNLDANPAS